MNGHLFDLIATGCTAAGGSAAVIFPMVARRERQRTLTAAELRDAQETARKLEQREAIKEVVDGAVGPMREEMARRFDENDRATRENAKATAEVTKATAALKAQWSPNGGSSALDTLTRLSTTVAAAKSQLDGVVDRFEDHLVQSAEDRHRLTRLEEKKP